MSADYPIYHPPARQVKAFDEIQFYRDIVVAALVDGVHYISVPQICRNLGLDIWGQSKKIRDPDNVDWTRPCLLEAESSGRLTVCIPVNAVSFWLSTIKSSMVKPEVREKIKLYRKEFFQVVAAFYATKTAAVEKNPCVAKAPDRAEALLQAVQLMVNLERRQKEAEEKTETIQETVHASAVTLDLAAKRIVELNERLDKFESKIRGVLSLLSDSVAAIMSPASPE